jgi:hypothetical protein
MIGWKSCLTFQNITALLGQGNIHENALPRIKRWLAPIDEQMLCG